MHELSLAQAMIDQLEEIVKREKMTRVEKITLEIGDMSGVEREAFEFVFPIASEKTIAAKAELIFDEKPVKVKCKVCDEVTSPEVPYIQCQKCKSLSVSIIEGRDFVIKSLEVS